MSKTREFLGAKKLRITLRRLAHQIVENYGDFSDTVFLALQPRGIEFAEQLYREIENIKPGCELKTGKLDITFFRDDFRNKALSANKTDIPHLLENNKVVLIDDVLYTGRSIRAALDAMLSYGRPSKVELMVLIDRRFQRELPIQPTFVGHKIDSVSTEYVEVQWAESDFKVTITSKEA